MRPPNIAVVGIWHQGAVLTACFADLGYRVTGVLASAEQAEQMNRGVTPVAEPDLGAIIQRNRKRRRLEYTTSTDAFRTAAFVFVSHDTPVNENDEPDVSPIMAAVEQIARVRKTAGVLCITAQVPVRTCDRIEAYLREHGCPLHVVYVPEFLRLGSAVESFRRPDRVVVGGAPAPAKKVKALYAPLKCEVFITDRRSAEMGKHASNCFLAASISFINEMADFCEIVGANVSDVATIMKLDRRVGKHAFLTAGLGFAGGTLGREIRALQAIAREHRKPSTLIDAVWDVNQRRAAMVVARLTHELGSLAGKRIAILGLTYKVGTPTMRRALSLDVIGHLVRGGASVRAYDPLANMAEVTDPPKFERVERVEDAFESADAAVLLTEWNGIGNVRWNRMRQKAKHGLFVDTRNLLAADVLTKAGFRYLQIGKGQ